VSERPGDRRAGGRDVSGGDGDRRAGLAVAAGRADLALFRRLAGAHNPVLDRTMPALSRAADWSRLWLGLALLLTLSGRPAWRRAAVRGLASVAVASAATNGLAKLWVGRHRPPLGDVPAARRVHRAPVTTSFPSGHAASAAAFTVGVALEAPALAAPVGAVGAGVAVSRVWTGAHYPADVLAGLAAGAAAGLVLARLRPPRHRRRHREDAPGRRGG
jgi:membrane-associated phospholipid phosphatase